MFESKGSVLLCYVLYIYTFLCYELYNVWGGLENFRIYC